MEVVVAVVQYLKTAWEVVEVVVAVAGHPQIQAVVAAEEGVLLVLLGEQVAVVDERVEEERLVLNLLDVLGVVEADLMVVEEVLVPTVAPPEFELAVVEAREALDFSLEVPAGREVVVEMVAEVLTALHSFLNAVQVVAGVSSWVAGLELAPSAQSL